jgi:hypothetical protein
VDVVEWRQAALFRLSCGMCVCVMLCVAVSCVCCVVCHDKGVLSGWCVYEITRVCGIVCVIGVCVRCAYVKTCLCVYGV